MQLNTAPAAIWGTWHAVLADPEACVVVSPADQIIQHEEAFEQQILHGLDYVNTHADFLAMGVKPTQPNTAYGYIQMGDEVDEKDMFKVQSFSEKPELNYARLFLESGEFLWNTGIFLWKGETMGRHLSEMAHRPDQPVEVVAQQMVTIAQEVDYVRSCIPEGLPRSIDLLVLEHCDNVARASLYVRLGRCWLLDRATRSVEDRCRRQCRNGRSQSYVARYAELYDSPPEGHEGHYCRP